MKVETTPPLCPRHNIQKFKQPGGSLICKQCNKERAKQRAEKRIASGEPPSPCTKCDGPRNWDTFGRPKCSPCSAGETKTWREQNEDKLIAGRRRYYEENREAVLANNRDYVARNSDKVRETRKAYQSQFDREYWMWRTMNARCYTPSNVSFRNYGGRGISVHASWRIDPTQPTEVNYQKYLVFKEYLDTALGERPTDNHSIDRKDNSGNYEPGNLKWSTRIEQANNTRRQMSYKLSIPDNSLIHFDNELITLSEFSTKVNIPTIICKYRYAQHPGNPDWIISDEYDNRYYEYQGHKYNMTELSLISGLSFQTLHDRINKRDWSVQRAVETSLLQ